VSGAPRRVGWLAKGILAAVSLVGTVLVLEQGARWLNLNTGFFLLPDDSNCLQRTGSLSMEFRPRCVGALAETHVSTNALGFRSPELRDDGSVRILAIGDSCTWGWHVGQDESYPAVLQRLLDQRAGAGRYQVINAGVPGYTSYQTLVALRDKGLPLHPAIVIIGAGFNDIYTSGDVEQQIAHERRWMPLLRLDDFLLDWSRLYRWARWQAAGGAKPTGAVRVTPEGYMRNIGTMVDLVRAHGAHPLLLSFWAPQTINQDYRQALILAADVAQVPLITYDGPLIDVVHPTVEGHRLLAGMIDDTMRAQGWVQ
jgi:lysophospholipase L1-like esterase